MGFKPTDTCLRKAADDEPIFVLRAQDRLAPEIVRLWAARLAYHRGADHPKVLEANRLAELMEQWPTRKIPD